MRFCVPVLTCLVALAAEGPARAESGASCRIVFVNRPDGAPRSLHLFDGVSSQEVELPSMNLSPVYQIGPGTTTLWLLAEPVIDPGKLPEDAPSVEMPEGVIDFYLLVTADEGDADAALTLKLLASDEATLLPGRMLWVNLTDKTIEGQVGEHELSLPPESQAAVPAPRPDQGDYPVNLDFLIEGQDFTHPLCQTSWRHDPRARSLVVVSTVDHRRVPRISSFTDFRN